MNVVITGGSGFIGSRLVQRLDREGHQVTVFDKVINPALAEMTRRGDVRNSEQVAAALRSADVVCHLAAEHRDDVSPPSLYDEVNVEGTRNVLVAAERAGCRRLVFASSVAVYPLNAREPDETFPIAPFNRYGESKAKAEDLIRQWAGADASRTAVIVRLCVVFGEGNRGNVYNLLRQIAARRFLMVGDGRNRKSMAYVGNVVEFMARCLALGPGLHLFNYADKPDLTTREIVDLARRQLGCANGLLRRLSVPYTVALAGGYLADFVARCAGRKLPVSSIRIRKFCAETTVSAARVAALGFKPPFTLTEGLHRTIAHEFGGG